MIRLVGRTRSNALARANALANALTLARELVRDLDNAEVPVGTLARTNALALALANASDLDLDFTLANALVHARDPTRDLARALASDLVRDLDAAAHWARAVVAGGARSMPGRMSRGLVALAVRLLPVAQRRRYCGEFRAELVELPSRERLGYSLRVLASAWELRRSLVEAGCTPDGAAARRAER